MHLLVVVILLGMVTGLLGRYLAHGDQDRSPVWLPIVCGVVGLLVGWHIAAAFLTDSRGPTVARLLIAVVVAATVSAVASKIYGHDSSPGLYVGRPEDLEDH